MKVRSLIINGIVIRTVIPIAVFEILDRYDNYLEQLEYEIDRIGIAKTVRN